MVSNLGKWTRHLSILEWKSMAHAIVRCFWLQSYCLSCLRAVESSLSSSKAMFLLTCWNERHPLHFTKPLSTWQHRYHPTRPQDMGRNSAAGLARSWRWWTQVALDRCLASFQAKHDRWCSRWAAQTSLCVNICERTFWAFNVTPIMHSLFSCLLILWTLG